MLCHGDVEIEVSEVHPLSRHEMLQRAFATLIDNGVAATVTQRVAAAAKANGAVTGEDSRATHLDAVAEWTKEAQADVLQRLKDGTLGQRRRRAARTLRVNTRCSV
jgi:hypothetical protein